MTPAALSAPLRIVALVMPMSYRASSPASIAIDAAAAKLRMISSARFMWPG